MDPGWGSRTCLTTIGCLEPRRGATQEEKRTLTGPSRTSTHSMLSGSFVASLDVRYTASIGGVRYMCTGVHTYTHVYELAQLGRGSTWGAMCCPLKPPPRTKHIGTDPNAPIPRRSPRSSHLHDCCKPRPCTPRFHPHTPAGLKKKGRAKRATETSGKKDVVCEPRTSVCQVNSRARGKKTCFNLIRFLGPLTQNLAAISCRARPTPRLRHTSRPEAPH